MPYLSAEERRRQFVEAGTAVVLQHGVEGATTRRIAAQAGAPLGALHYAFRDKEELFTEIYASWIASYGEQLIALVPEGCGLAKGVKILMTELFDLFTSDRDTITAQFELFFWALRSPAAGDLAERVYTAYNDLYLTALQRANAGQESAAKVRKLQRFVFCSMDGLVIKALAAGPDAARKDLKLFIFSAVALAETG